MGMFDLFKKKTNPVSRKNINKDKLMIDTASIPLDVKKLLFISKKEVTILSLLKL